MALSFSEICWAIIAITLLLALLFGWDLAG